MNRTLDLSLLPSSGRGSKRTYLGTRASKTSLATFRTFSSALPVSWPGSDSARPSWTFEGEALPRASVAFRARGDLSDLGAGAVVVGKRERVNGQKAVRGLACGDYK